MATANNLRSRRDHSTEATDIIKNNRHLQNLFRDKTVAGSATSDHKGFMYLSRYKEETNTLKKNDPEERKSEANVDVKAVTSSIEKLVATAPSASSSNFEVKRKYATSLATLAAKEDKRDVIVNEGGLAVLVELSSLPDKKIQMRCASAFSHLAKQESIRGRMLEEGCLLAVLNLTSSSNVLEVKIDCCRTICNLSVEKGYEYKMIKEGVPQVLSHFASVNAECFDICLKILLNVSCVPDKYSRIEDVTDALMLFNSYPLLTTAQETLILSTFVNLSALRNNQLRLVEDGCLRVVEKYYRTENESHRTMSCEILKNLTTDGRTRAKLLEHNVVTILLEMSKDSMDSIRMTITKAFLHLSKDTNFRRKIMHGEAVDYILQNCRTETKNQEMDRVAAKTLRVLCSDPGIAPLLVNNGMGAALLHMLQFEDPMVQQYCVESIAAISLMKDAIISLVEQNAVEAIVQLAHVCEGVKTIEWCAFILYRVSINGACSTVELLEKSVLPCIIDLSKNTSDRTKAFCAASIAHITSLKTVQCSGAIPLLIAMLRDEGEQVVKKYCALSLFNLADNDENCFLILDSEALYPVIQLTQSQHMQTKVICAGIISRLSLHKKYYSQFSADNVLKVLLELSCVDHRLTQRRVVTALSNLSQDENLRSLLLELNPIPYIISLASERDEYLRRGCISIVCNMSYLPGSERAIVTAGIIPTLMITSLITSDQVISKIICVKALVNLMADRSLYQVMVKNGVIWGLSKLAQVDEPELLLLCAKALCCMSCDYFREMMDSNVAVRTIMMLIDNPDMTLKKVGAHTLTNILLKSTDKDEDFRKHAVENMSSLTQCKDEELNEICVLLLCLASQSESCRPTIVSSGMLQMIDVTTIFAEKRISYAYITMFSNIANNPSMRTEVLDDRAVERFEKICSSRDQDLMLSVAMALYCVSCDDKNIPELVDQKIVPFIYWMIEEPEEEELEGEDDVIVVVEGDVGGESSQEYETSAENSKVDGVEEEEKDAERRKRREAERKEQQKQKMENSPELYGHLIACLHNLATNVSVQSRLVSQGFVEVMSMLWPEAQKNFQLCTLAYISICHLACGKTNSNRMVTDGCGPILCSIIQMSTGGVVNSQQFSSDVKLRCSAAMRNLLSIQSNQQPLVASGCIRVLLKLSEEAQAAAGPLYSQVQANCAAALKSLTYNRALRDTLSQSEAIDVIMSDMTKESEEMPISSGLLREMEAESWDNGARGISKDGRAPFLPPGRLYTDMLRGITNVQLNVDLYYCSLDKFYVQVNLDEHGDSSDGSTLYTNNNESSAADDSASATNTAAAARMGGKMGGGVGGGDREREEERDSGAGADEDGIELNITSLNTHDDAEDMLNTVVMAYPKQECEISAAAVASNVKFFRSDTMASIASDEYTSSAADLRGESTTIGGENSGLLSSAGAGGAVGGAGGGGGGGTESTARLLGDNNKHNSNNNNNIICNSKNEKENVRRDKEPRENSQPNLNLNTQQNSVTFHTGSHGAPPPMMYSADPSYFDSNNSMLHSRSMASESHSTDSYPPRAEHSSSRKKSFGSSGGGGGGGGVRVDSKSPTSIDAQFKKKFNKFALPNLFMAVSNMDEEEGRTGGGGINGKPRSRRHKLPGLRGYTPKANSSMRRSRSRSPGREGSSGRDRRTALSQSAPILQLPKSQTDLEIDEMVSLIKKAKKGGGGTSIHDVMNRWNELSKF